MKVLILGGNGFIGSNLTKILSENMAYDVTSFDCRIPAVRQPGVHYIQGDFFCDQILSELVPSFDVIYHAISTVTPGSSNDKYLDGYERDFLQSVRLCEAVHRERKRLIFLSSGGTVYGKKEKMPVMEEDACNPINHYGALKRCIETVMLTYDVQNQDQMFVARLSNPYGPGQDYRKGVGIIDAAIKHAMDGTPLLIWGDGEVVRDFIYISDACRMLEALIDYHGDRRVFNVSSGKGYSVNHIVEIVRRSYPDLKTNYSPGRSVDIPRIILDNSKIKEIYHQPLVSLEDGITILEEELARGSLIHNGRNRSERNV